MIVVRNVFQAKYGRGGELVALFKELRDRAPQFGRDTRLLTDASGPFFTVVTETQYDSLAAWEKAAQEMFANAEFGGWFQRMIPLVENGRREFWNVEG